MTSYDQSLNLTGRVPYTDPDSHFRKRTLSVLPPINYAPYGRTRDGRKLRRCGGGNNTRTMTGHFIWLCPLRRLWLIIFTDIRRAPAPRIRFRFAPTAYPFISTQSTFDAAHFTPQIGVKALEKRLLNRTSERDDSLN